MVGIYASWKLASAVNQVFPTTEWAETFSNPSLLRVVFLLLQLLS